ncbi:hypothetical protein CLCR_09116 [Cladophialophora carrionii]|uniref:GPI anchored cell wall protein n=1 Tax=Cladophialophora carrionii TaxID=86049 RepID=A0A1C1CSS7_9EURO|nr:hypothetical protein CLCR_09116 [Cladophialophora carrionii]
MKTSIILPVFALAARVLAATPPACLLNAVNTQDDPSDLSSICGDDAIDVQEVIASVCNGNAVSMAQSAFISTCSAAGSSVAPYTATSTSNSTASTTKGSSSATSAGTFVYTTAVFDPDCSCTTTVVATATTGSVVSTALASATGADGASSSSGSGASASGNAAADTKQVGSFAAAVIAIAGVVAVL